MNRALAGAFAAWALLASPGAGLAQLPDEPQERERAELGGLIDRDRPLEIEADELVYEQARDIYEATGNVLIRQPDGATLEADWVTFNATTFIGVASGNVVLRQGDDVVRSQFATVDLRRTVAMATHATVDTPDPGFAFEGETVRKTGVNTYSLERAVFTTCRCQPDGTRRPWQIEADRADVRVGGYAVARDVTFRALGVPVLYTPWLALPVKTERQTGFLIPTFETSTRNGVTFSTPFFWAASDQVNVLLAPTYYTDRGFKAFGATEYVFDERGFGRAGGAVLPNDQEVHRPPLQTPGAADPSNPNTDDTPFSEHRWAYFWRHEQPLEQGIRLGTDISAASDNEYVVDFDDLDSHYRNARFMESIAFASYARRNNYADVELAYNDDLQNPDDLDRDAKLLQRLPDVQAARLPDQIPFLAEAFPRIPLHASIDTRYTYFVQSERRDNRFDVVGGPTDFGLVGPVGGRFFDTGIDGIFDPDETGFPLAGTNDPHRDDFVLIPGGTEGDGIFQEGELLADRGHRVELEPRLSLPLRLGIVELLSEAGVREALYYTHEFSGESRTAFTGRVDARTRFGRRFELGQARLDHLVEPGVAFGLLETHETEDRPLFVPQAAVRPRRIIAGDLRTLLREPTDRLEDERVLTASVGNRLYTRSGAADTSRLLGELRLAASYDFVRDDADTEDQEQKSLSYLFVDSAVHPWRNLLLQGQLGYDPEESDVEEALAAVSWRGDTDHRLAPNDVERRHEVRLAYRYLRDLPPFFEDFRRSDEVFEDAEENFDRIEQLNATGVWVATRMLDLFVNGYTSLESSKVSGGSIGGLLHSECACWRVRVELERRLRPEDTRFRVNLQLAGFGL